MEKVGQKFHGIGSNARDVAIFAVVWMLRAQRFYAILHIVGHFHSYLHAQTELVRKQFAQRYQQAAVAAANVSKFHVATLAIIFGPVH